MKRFSMAIVAAGLLALGGLAIPAEGQAGDVCQTVYYRDGVITPLAIVDCATVQADLCVQAYFKNGVLTQGQTQDCGQYQPCQTAFLRNDVLDQPGAGLDCPQ